RHARPREDARPGVHLPANLCRDRALDLFLDPELTLPGRLERPVAMFQVDHMRLERGAGRIRFISVDGQFFVQACHEVGAPARRPSYRATTFASIAVPFVSGSYP